MATETKITQDEAGTAAYKTVEVDEFLHGAATQHREVQEHPSEDLTALFRRRQVRTLRQVHAGDGISGVNVSAIGEHLATSGWNWGMEVGTGRRY
ncbi:hypothetical protein BDW66DRAFT_151428 [Aspergillus desertorum]